MQRCKYLPCSVHVAGKLCILNEVAIADSLLHGLFCCEVIICKMYMEYLIYICQLDLYNWKKLFFSDRWRQVYHNCGHKLKWRGHDDVYNIICLGLGDMNKI